MAFDHLSTERFVSLVTFRKSGDRVATPVWFAVDGPSVVVGTFEDSGKAKRLKHTDRVEIAPCNFRGLVRGSYVAGVARVLDPADAILAAAALSDKYGWQWDMFSRNVDMFLSVDRAEDN